MKKLSVMEAWADFWLSYLEENSGKIPNELSVANATFNGLVLQKNGKPKTLGVNRVWRLLQKYAPGVYTYHEAKTTVTINNQSA